MSKQAVARYYDYMVGFYRFWFVSSRASALHYGFSQRRGESFTDTLINTNRFLAKKAGIKPTDRVLDAGCGLGGSSLWLASEIGCQVTGITLSRAQVERATKRAAQQGLAAKAQFLVMDYTHTNFPDASFDVVWALESLCYAADKLAFLREAYRLLKPGGTLVMGDGFLLRVPRNQREKKQRERFEHGFVIPPLSTPVEFKRHLQQASFTHIHFWETTPQIERSSKRMYWLCLPSYPIAKLLELLHITKPILTANNRAGLAQRFLVRRGVAGYGVYTARR
ncbi:MAG TPA: methyltransferase domain-containing protein [Candidatus Saccharimonadales bacterium]|nr:methyltransferase domain-containing protein [Candidatus Saccharimonadales bacterium]